MKRSGPMLAAVLFISMDVGATSGSERDPLPVLQAMIDAVRRANLDAAMASFADDAVIVNVTGWKTANRNELKWFVNTEIWLRDNFDLDQIHADGNRVTWMEAVVAPFYKNIGVAPVQFAFEAIVQGGQITSIIAHLPTPEIARINEACKARTPEPLIRDRPCSEFVQSIEAHTKSHAAAAQVQESRGR